MTVSELIAVLSKADQNLPVAVHANNHTYTSAMDSTHGGLRIAAMHTYAGDYVVIGNVSKKNVNGRSWHVTEMIDGGKDLPMEWFGPSRQIMVGGHTPLGCVRCEGPDAK